ncbi:MAG: tryptophan-rich sensory protein [Myxococcota bacterium]
MARARILAVVNAVVVLGVVGWNYWTATFGFRGRTVGGMSDAYRTLFTPAGYAFSIWGLIFLGLIVHAGYQLWLAFVAKQPEGGERAEHRATFFARLGPWLIATNVANALWVVLWLSEQTAASVVTLGSMALFLHYAMWRLDMETWDAPLEVIVFVWWPIVVYAGWVTVAVLANLSAFLAKHGWVSGDSVPWALAMIALATGINLALVWRRNLREHAVVAIWALVAIAVRNEQGASAVRGAALGAASLLAVVVVAHALKNRQTLPFLRR